MKSIKTMLLGVTIAFLGLALAQPGNNDLLFRTFIFLPPEALTVYFPLVSLLFVLVGVIVGLIGYFRKQ